ncbi:MAG: DEAD/DEAH box helicase family protein [Candidatus Marinimicrobia bacterium]|nr:DEAD/DEAH box helicase family protein [Candidatus Neomarinimicrobiota bacterium]
MENKSKKEPEIQRIHRELGELEDKREKLLNRITELEYDAKNSLDPVASNRSHYSEKIRLFRSLFKGREDVFPRRFESTKTGRTGYQPACENEWIPGICAKPRVKCAVCEQRELIPVSDSIIRNHLLGYDPDEASKRDFTVGVYPLLGNETCYFLAVDFDKSAWREDVMAYLKTCRKYRIPAVLERSRSGNGGHIWVFFTEPIHTSTARKMGTFILTETMKTRPEIGFDSYDRLFPNQDTMPKGGFGNLIALPLQARPRTAGNSVFVDADLVPYSDQWKFLSTIEKMRLTQIESIVAAAEQKGKIIGVQPVYPENGEPWAASPSGKYENEPIPADLPQEIELVFGNQIYIPKIDIPPALLNRLIRIAAFQNPEFYKAQAMRLSTWNKPRIIACHEEFPQHIGLPRGCWEDLIKLLESLSIRPRIVDKRVAGRIIKVNYLGDLRPQQQDCVDQLLKNDTGVIAASTAFGKTIVAIYMVAERKVNTLILVHRRQLMDQWLSRLEYFLDLDKADLGQIGGGKWKPTGIIDVAIIQSLRKQGVVNDIVGDYGQVIIDECHHISARSFEVVARQCQAKYVLGLSATVTRKDGHHPIIFMNIGPVRFKVGHRTQAEQRPFTHRVLFRTTEFKLPAELQEDDSPSISAIYSALANDNKRNQMIIKDVLLAVKNGRSPVILTERRNHLEILKSMLECELSNVIVFRGGMGIKQRRATREKMSGIADEEERVILATGKYLGEGFDDARLDTLFLTMPVSWRGVLAQYAGRLHRLHDRKVEVIIYDYVDQEIPLLKRMYKRRLTGYKSIGYSCARLASQIEF